MVRFQRFLDVDAALVAASAIVDLDGTKGHDETPVDQGVDIGKQDKVAHVLLRPLQDFLESESCEADDVEMVFLLREPGDGNGIVEIAERIASGKRDARGGLLVLFKDGIELVNADLGSGIERPCRRVLAKWTVMDAALEKDDDTDARAIDDGFFRETGKSHVFSFIRKSLLRAGF